MIEGLDNVPTLVSVLGSAFVGGLVGFYSAKIGLNNKIRDTHLEISKIITDKEKDLIDRIHNKEKDLIEKIHAKEKELLEFRHRLDGFKESLVGFDQQFRDLNENFLAILKK